MQHRCPQRAPLAPIWPLRAPIRTTPPSIACRRVFFLFHFMFFVEMPYFFPIFCFCVPFFVQCTSMLSSIIYRRYCIVQQAQHSTAQSARTKPPSKYVPMRLRQARTQTELARASKCRRAFIQHDEFSKPTKKSKSAYPTKTRNYSHSVTGVMGEGLALSFDLDLNKIQHCWFSPPFLAGTWYVFRACMRRPGCYPGAWSS